MDFGIAKFRIAKFSHCEIRIGIANFKLALRNGFWHCEISHCEIFALRNWNWHCEMDFGIAKFSLALRNGLWHCEIFFGIAKFSQCEISQRAIFAKLQCTGDFGFRNAKLVCEQFAKFSHCEIGLRTVCENPVLLIFHAFLPVFNCISFSSLFLRFSIDFWAC